MTRHNVFISSRNNGPKLDLKFVPKLLAHIDPGHSGHASGPRWRQHVSRCPKMPENGPKMAPRCPKMGPRWCHNPQDGLKMVPECFPNGPRWPKMGRDGPKPAARCPQDVPRRSSNFAFDFKTPRMARNGHRMAARWFQDSSKMIVNQNE